MNESEVNPLWVERPICYCLPVLSDARGTEEPLGP